MKDLVRYCQVNNLSYCQMIGFVLGTDLATIEMYREKEPRLYKLLHRAIVEYYNDWDRTRTDKVRLWSPIK